LCRYKRPLRGARRRGGINRSSEQLSLFAASINASPEAEQDVH